MFKLHCYASYLCYTLDEIDNLILLYSDKWRQYVMTDCLDFDPDSKFEMPFFLLPAVSRICSCCCLIILDFCLFH